jgi:hypothetical protein
MLITAYSLLSQRVDNRDRRDRIEQRTRDWNMQYDSLLNAYLEYGMHEDEEMKSAAPIPYNPTQILELNVVDIFCE